MSTTKKSLSTFYLTRTHLLMTLVDKDMNNLLKKQIVYTNILSYLCDKEIKREYHENK
jgi:hypothetical protein